MFKQNKFIIEYHKIIFMSCLAVAILYILDFIEYNMLLPGDINIKWVVAIATLFAGWLMYELYLEDNTKQAQPLHSKFQRTRPPPNIHPTVQRPMQRDYASHNPSFQHYSPVNASNARPPSFPHTLPIKMPQNNVAEKIKYVNPVSGNIVPPQPAVAMPVTVAVENDALPADLAKDLGLVPVIDQPTEQIKQTGQIDQSQYVSENNPFKQFGFEQ